jgi:lysophospholipase L1-like esterase
MKLFCNSRRLGAVLALAVLMSGAALAFGAADAVAPPGRDDGPWIPFWPDLNNAINARVKQGNVDLIFVGDSITQLWATEGKEVWEKFYRKRNAVNMGIGGDMTDHVLWRLERGNIDGISPKLAVVLVGTNNSTAGAAPEDIAKGIKAIVDHLQAKLPKTKILLMGIFPRGADDQDKCCQNNKKVNVIIAKLADDKTVFYLDIGAKFANADGTIKKELLPDAPYYLHLSKEGFTVWAESIEPIVAKFVGENNP